MRNSPYRGYVLTTFCLLGLQVPPHWLLWKNYITSSQFFGIQAALLSLILVFWLLPLARLLQVLKNQLNIKNKKLPTWKLVSLVEKTLEETFRDIESHGEDLFRQNQKFSLLIESLPDPIVALNQNGEILFYNKVFTQKFLSEKLKSQTYGRPLKEFFINSQFQSLIQEALKGKPLPRTPPIKILSGTHYQGHFEILANPIKNSTDELQGAIIIFHDVREKKLAEKMREDFVANVGHEVRTPLTALNGHVEILQKMVASKNDNPEMAQVLNKIKQTSKRLNALFNDILSLSVIESDIELHIEEIHLESLILNIIDELKQTYPKVNHEIEIDVPQEVEFIEANGKWMEQVLANLLENAYKYVPSPGKIKIKWWKDPSWIYCTISDNGPGIPERYAERIFERFFRLDKARGQEISGTGLGLAIVKHILQKHGGQISLLSSENQGSAFHFKIPTMLKRKIS